MTDTTPATRLREATREAHRRVESVPAMRRLLSSSLDRDGLRATLARIHGFLDPLETRLALYPDVAAIGFRPRAALLRTDLAALGWAATDIADLPRGGPPDWVDRPAAALGAAYVLEGSRAGAPTIHLRLTATLGASDPAAGGLSYFGDLAGLGEGGLADLRRALDAWFARRPPADLACAVDSAVRTFDRLYQWMLDKNVWVASEP